MKSNILLVLVKWTLAMGLLYFVIRSGNLSLESVKVFLGHPWASGSVFAIVFMGAALSFFRWKLILNGFGISMDFRTAFRLGMLGQFFSIVTPGVVGGDLAKGVYIARKYPSKKARALTSLFADRVAGLMGLLVLGSLAFVLGFDNLNSLEPGKEKSLALTMGWMVFLGGLAVLVGLALVPILGRRFASRPIPKILHKLPMHRLWERLYFFIGDFGTEYRFLWIATALASLGHVLVLFSSFWVSSVVFGPEPWGTLSRSNFVLAYVLGMCAMAVPITPMGLGVGQIVCATLFWIMGAPSKEFGSALITNLQLVQIFVGITGVYFFATYKNVRDEDSLSYESQSK